MPVKGRAVTTAQRAYHDVLCSVVGCVACRKEGRVNTWVSVHHIDGRTKPDAHWLVLPLCAGHHQPGTGAPGLIAVHGSKRQFEALYGTQMELLAWCVELLDGLGYDVPERVREISGALLRAEN